MKRSTILLLLLPLLLMLAGVVGTDAQTYKATYASTLFLSGGGSPIKPLTIQAPTLSAPYTLTFPGDDGAANQFLQTDGSGNLVWTSLSSALLPLSASVSNAGILLDITNTGTGDVAQFEISNASSTGNALTAITNGTGLAILANGGVQVTNGNLSLTSTSAAGQLRLHEESGGPDYTAFQAQNQFGDNITYTMPGVNGSAGQVLAVASSPTPTANAATLEWVAAGGIVTHNATLTGNGTVGSPLGINLGNANTWTANQTFAGTFLIASNARIALTNSDNNGRDIRWQEPSGTGTQYIGIRAPSVTNNGNYVWPAVVGSVGQVLSLATSNGVDSATMQWTTPVTGITLPYSQTAGDISPLFSITNTDNAAGGAGVFRITDASNSGDALLGSTDGSGHGVRAGSSGAGHALGAVADLTSTGSAGTFMTQNSANSTPTVSIINAGTGDAVSSSANGAAGHAGAFNVGDASNADAAVSATTTGTGSAGSFEIMNASSSSPALTATTNGTGPALRTSGSGEIGNGNLSLTNTGTAGELRFSEPSAGGSEYTALKAQAQANSITYTLPATNGSAGQVLAVASSPAPTSTTASLEWASGGGLSTVTHNATLTGNGTVGSPLGINLGNANTWTANQTFAGTFLIASNARIALTNSDNNGRDIRWQEPSGTGTQYIGIRAPSVTNNGNYVWPAVVGSVGQVLSLATSNGVDSATMQWTTVSGGGTSTVDSTLIGDGSGGSPLGLDLAQVNVWTATITSFLGFLEVRNEPLVITNTDNAANEIRIQEASGNGSNYMAFRADTSISTNDVWILPSTAGTVGQMLGITAVNTPSNRFYTLDWMTPSSSGGAQSVAVTSGAQGTITLNSGTTLVRFTGATGAYTIDGFTGGADGRVIYLYNTTAQNMTLKFNTATTAANGINTMNGIDASTVGEGGAVLIYDSGSSRWLVMTVRG